MSERIPLNFSAHARLKDIVGRELIINDDIAIIELIKNSKDADASGVDIKFRAANESRVTELVISDDGIGMSQKDIQHKWLNIAYSEKKNQKKKVGAYAGSKGIGRFSCDRLGTELTIITKKSDHNAVKLEVDWTKFEVDKQDSEIGSIKVFSTELSIEEFQRESTNCNATHGTTLIIRNLRINWNKDRIKDLRKELEKFIVDPSKSFSVNLQHWKFKAEDKVNGPIENKIFKELDFRTTSIEANIDDEGKFIKLELRHDGEYLFRSIESNPYSDLKNISLQIFYLSQPAKVFFKRFTGYRSVDYGSVFMFLNSFRVFPYGSIGDDWLGLEKRKSQGQRRYFGLRDIIGFVEVIDSVDNFKPVSSREGVWKNSAYFQLTADKPTIKSNIDDERIYGFFHKVLRKLEKFVVDGLDWDRIGRIIRKTSEEDLSPEDDKFLEKKYLVLENFDSVVRIRSPESHIIDIDINLAYLDKLAHKEIQDYKEFVEKLQEQLDNTPIERLKPADKRNLSRFISRQAKEIASKNKTNVNVEIKAKKANEDLKNEQRKRIFAEFEVTADQTRIIQLHHQVGLVADSLLKRIDYTIRKFRKDPKLFSKEQLLQIIEQSIYEISKIRNVTKLSTKANFDLSTNMVQEDLIQYIEEYIDNFNDLEFGWNLVTQFSNPDKIVLNKYFRPIEVTILVDNLIDNAGKANSNHVNISVSEINNLVLLDFEDDGDGLVNNISPEEFFNKGISTTQGSGIGLNHARQIVNDLDGKISINNHLNGSLVRMEFVK